MQKSVMKLAIGFLAVILLTLPGCQFNRSQQLAPGQVSMNEMEKRRTDQGRKHADQGAALLAEARAFTPDQVQAKIAQFQTNPRDAKTYGQLMRYYESKQDVQGKNAVILWTIEHAPAGEVAPWNINPAWDRAAYKKGKALWLKHASQPTPGAAVYIRAAGYLEGADKPRAEALLLAGRKAFPADPRWTNQLAKHYALALLGSAEPLTEMNVFRQVSLKEVQSTYAQLTRTKLSASTDVPLLVETSHWIVGAGAGPRGDGFSADNLGLATAYAARAVQLEPDNPQARMAVAEVEHLKTELRLHQLVRLAPAERAQLSEADRLRLLLWEIDTASWREKSDEAAAKAKQVLALATPTPTDGLHSEAAFEANIVLGKAALRDGNKRQAVQYMMAAAASPDSDQLRQSGGFGYSFSPGAMDMNLMRALVDWGERNAVAEFLDEMAPKIKRTREFQQWAADIRKGLNPDLIPTRGGCKVGPC